MDLNLRVFKEPRGFIRIIQFIMGIFAFSTSGGFSTTASFWVNCSAYHWEKEIIYYFAYPFILQSFPMLVPEKCTNATKIVHESISLPYSFSSSAQFFVAVGVLSFLYCIGITVVYVIFHQMYAQNPMTPFADLAISGVLGVFWLAGASAWAQGVGDLKYYTNPENFQKKIPICVSGLCEKFRPGNFATLNVSLIFGFANFLLWFAGLWFIYKETTFHRPPQPPMQTPGGMQTQQVPGQQKWETQMSP